MKALTKLERETVREKFGGRCAYCGGALPARWHADHLEPVIRLEWIGLPTGRPENHRIENIMPACPQCNISKGSMSLEAWRVWLSAHVTSLNRHHSIYRLARAFGLIQETGAPVEFFFEMGDARPENSTEERT